MADKGISATGGVTRAVLLVGTYAFKAPRLRYGWSKFLHGLLSNLTEARFTPLARELRLCPTILSIPGGFLNVQRRCLSLTDVEWEQVRHNDYDVHGRANWHGMDCDFKRDNFGNLDGRVVLLDYGELR